MLQHVNGHFVPLLGRCLITLTENETSFLLEILSGKAEEAVTRICWENSQNRKMLLELNNSGAQWWSLEWV